MPDVAIDLGGLSPVYVAIPIPVGVGTTKAATGKILFGGWSVINPGAAAERVDFFDGVDNTGTRVGGAIVPASDGRAHTYQSPGIYCQSGVAVVSAGADLVVVCHLAYLD